MELKVRAYIVREFTHINWTVEVKAQFSPSKGWEHQSEIQKIFN